MPPDMRSAIPNHWVRVLKDSVPAVFGLTTFRSTIARTNSEYAKGPMKKLALRQSIR
jgi:hypothetical protein